MPFNLSFATTDRKTTSLQLFDLVEQPEGELTQIWPQKQESPRFRVGLGKKATKVALHHLYAFSPRKHQH